MYCGQQLFPVRCWCRLLPSASQLLKQVSGCTVPHCAVWCSAVLQQDVSCCVMLPRSALLPRIACPCTAPLCTAMYCSRCLPLQAPQTPLHAIALLSHSPNLLPIEVGLQVSVRWALSCICTLQGPSHARYTKPCSSMSAQRQWSCCCFFMHDALRCCNQGCQMLAVVHTGLPCSAAWQMHWSCCSLCRRQHTHCMHVADDSDIETAGWVVLEVGIGCRLPPLLLPMLLLLAAHPSGGNQSWACRLCMGSWTAMLLSFRGLASEYLASRGLCQPPLPWGW